MKICKSVEAAVVPGFLKSGRFLMAGNEVQLGNERKYQMYS